MGQGASTEGLTEVIAEAVTNAALCPGILMSSVASPLVPAARSDRRLEGEDAADRDGGSADEEGDADIDSEWTTVTVADASSSAEDFLANLRKDLERTLVPVAPATPPTGLATPGGPPSGQTAAELSSVVPNSVLIRLALLQPFMRGASVFDALSFEDKPASSGSSMSGFRLARPVVTLNGLPVESISAFKDDLQVAAAAAVADSGERQAVQQVVLLLVHNRFSKLCVDAGKLAFGDPSLSLAPSNVDVTCLPGRVRFVSKCALVSKRGEAAASDGTDTGAAANRNVTMTLVWDFAPMSTPFTAWTAMASCFSGLAAGGSDDFAAQRGREAAAVVTFRRP